MASQLYIQDTFEQLEDSFKTLERIICSSAIEIGGNEGKLYPENMLGWQNLYGRLKYLSAQCKQTMESLEKGGCI